MSRHVLAILGAVACTSATVDPAHKDRVHAEDTGHTDSGGADDTAEPPAPETCAPPSLRLVAEFGHMELADVSAFDPPVALASCGWGLAAVDLNGDGMLDYQEFAKLFSEHEQQKLEQAHAPRKDA